MMLILKDSDSDPGAVHVQMHAVQLVFMSTWPPICCIVRISTEDQCGWTSYLMGLVSTQELVGEYLCADVDPMSGGKVSFDYVRILLGELELVPGDHYSFCLIQ